MSMAPAPADLNGGVPPTPIADLTKMNPLGGDTPALSAEVSPLTGGPDLTVEPDPSTLQGGGEELTPEQVAEAAAAQEAYDALSDEAKAEFDAAKAAEAEAAAKAEADKADLEKSEEALTPENILKSSVEVDGVSVPVNDAVDTHLAVRQIVESLSKPGTNTDELMGEVLEGGFKFALFKQQILESPQSALTGIQNLIAEVEQHLVSTNPDGFNVEAIDFGLLRDEDMTSTERALRFHLAKSLNQVSVLTNSLTQTKAELETKLKELAPAIKAGTLGKAIDSTVELIKSEYGDNVTAAQIRTMMEKQGLDDPLQAYKLGRFDSLAKEVPKGEVPASAKVGNSSEERTFDFNDPNLTADEAERLMRQGYKPVSVR